MTTLAERIERLRSVALGAIRTHKLRDHSEELALSILADVRELERNDARYRIIRNPAHAIVYVKDENAWGPGAIGHMRYDTTEQLDAAVDAILTKTKGSTT